MKRFRYILLLVTLLLSTLYSYLIAASDCRTLILGPQKERLEIPAYLARLITSSQYRQDDGTFNLPAVTQEIGRLVVRQLERVSLFETEKNPNLSKAIETAIHNDFQKLNPSLVIEIFKAADALGIPVLVETAKRRIELAPLKDISGEQLATLPAQLCNSILLDRVAMLLETRSNDTFLPIRRGNNYFGGMRAQENYSPRSLYISRDGKKIVGVFDDESIRVFDMKRMQLAVHKPERSSKIRIAGFTTDNKVVFSSNGSVSRWSMEEGRLPEIIIARTDSATTDSLNNDSTRTARLKASIEPISAICLAKDLILLGYQDGRLHIYEMNGKKIADCKGHEMSIKIVRVIDENAFLSASNDSIRTWSMAGKERTKSDVRAPITTGTTSTGQILPKQSSSMIVAAVPASYGMIVSGGSDGKVQVWNSDGKRSDLCATHHKPVTALAVFQNKVISGFGDGTLQLWDFKTKESITREAHTGSVKIICIPQDSDTFWLRSGGTGQFATCGDDNIRIWEIDGTEIGRCNAYRSPITSLCFANMGRSILSGSYDGIIRIWDRNKIVWAHSILKLERNAGAMWDLLVKCERENLNQESCWSTVRSMLLEDITDAEQLYRLGMVCRAQGSLKEARQLFVKAATKNHLESLYEAGCGMVLDQEQALVYFARAFERGHVNALYKAGLIYIRYRDIHRAREFFKNRAKDFFKVPSCQGIIDAMSSYAEAEYKFGIFCFQQGEKDLAREFFSRVAELNPRVVKGHHIAAQYNAGLLHSHVGGNKTKAKEFLEKAFQNGNAEAAFRLGVLYDGEGNLDKASEWLELAVSKHHNEAQSYWGYVLRSLGKREKAKEAFKVAADKDDTDAQYELGCMLAEDRKENEAIVVLKPAARKGHAKAQNNLGILLARSGKTDEARHWFQESERRGNSNASANLKKLQRDETFELFLPTVPSVQFEDNDIEASLEEYVQEENGSNSGDSNEDDNDESGDDAWRGPYMRGVQNNNRWDDDDDG